MSRFRLVLKSSSTAMTDNNFSTALNQSELTFYWRVIKIAHVFINTCIPAGFKICMLRTHSSSVSHICCLSLTLQTPNIRWFAKWLLLALMGSLGVTGESDCRCSGVDNQAAAAATPEGCDFSQSFES